MIKFDEASEIERWFFYHLDRKVVEELLETPKFKDHKEVEAIISVNGISVDADTFISTMADTWKWREEEVEKKALELLKDKLGDTVDKLYELGEQADEHLRILLAKEKTP